MLKIRRIFELQVFRLHNTAYRVKAQYKNKPHAILKTVMNNGASFLYACVAELAGSNSRTRVHLAHSCSRKAIQADKESQLGGETKNVAPRWHVPHAPRPHHH